MFTRRVPIAVFENVLGIIAIFISGQSPSVALSNIAASDAGTVIGPITILTSPPGGSQSTPIVLSGTDAALFSVTNGGNIPCNLVVGTKNIGSGSYSITLSVT
jgi:hypothetical protein